MITQDTILEVLSDWNFWDRKGPETGIERPEYLKTIEQYMKAGMVVSLVGLRRSGKSTLMLQFAKKLINEKNTSAKNILYVNFEDSRFLGEYSLELLNAIYGTYIEQIKPVGKPFIFLDEVQNITGWEKFVHSLYERRAANIFVSGSNAHLLRSEFSTALTGRQLTVMVYPLSFKEFLAFHKIQADTPLSIVRQKGKIKQMFSRYQSSGGMPKSTLLKTEKERNDLLRNYVEDILTRDLIQRFKIRQTEKLKTLAKFYFSNIASPISYHRVKNFLKIPLTTIERFSDNLTAPFLFSFVNKFAFSLKEQAVNPRKIYAGDVGLRNAISFQSGEDKGKLLENIVFLYLQKSGKEIFYYKTKNNLEVDFLIQERQKVKQLIQVCLTLKKFDTREREIKALRAAMEELRLSTGFIITEDEEEVMGVAGKTIIVKPAWKWLLEKES